MYCTVYISKMNEGKNFSVLLFCRLPVVSARMNERKAYSEWVFSRLSLLQSELKYRSFRFDVGVCIQQVLSANVVSVFVDFIFALL